RAHPTAADPLPTPRASDRCRPAADPLPTAATLEDMDVREDVRLDIEECVRDVEKCLPHNVLSLEHAVDFQIRIQRRADDAIRHGLEAELPRLRTLLERVDRAAHKIVLHEMVFELGFGE